LGLGRKVVEKIIVHPDELIHEAVKLTEVAHIHYIEVLEYNGDNWLRSLQENLLAVIFDAPVLPYIIHYIKGLEDG
jgi:hypothetical protein